MQQFQSMVHTSQAFDAAYAIANGSGIIRELKEDKSFEGMARFQNIEEILNSIKEFTDTQKEEGVTETIALADYMENVSLLTDADTQKPEDRDKVTVMTIHSAKGLEFNYVFLTGVEEDLFPSKMTLTSPEGLEEERRLFYVAITRAAKKATISYAQTRYKWGNLSHCVPSRFINEIDSEWVDMPADLNAAPLDFEASSSSGSRFGGGFHQSRNLTSLGNSDTSNPGSGNLYGRKTAVTEPNSGEASDPTSIVTGMQVTHERFGAGKVINVEGEGQNRKATVFFQSAGQKQLLLKFARLKIIG